MFLSPLVTVQNTDVRYILIMCRVCQSQLGSSISSQYPTSAPTPTVTATSTAAAMHYAVLHPSQVSLLQMAPCTDDSTVASSFYTSASFKLRCERFMAPSPFLYVSTAYPLEDCMDSCAAANAMSRNITCTAVSFHADMSTVWVRWGGNCGLFSLPGNGVAVNRDVVTAKLCKDKECEVMFWDDPS